MYDLWVAVIIGIVEGVTEFLPVSSTGHMILTEELLNLNSSDPLMNTFIIVIQLGAILAVVLIYWKKILQLFGLSKRTVANHAEKHSKRQQLNLIHIFIGITPAMVLAFFMNDFIESHLFSSITVLIGLVLGGILLIVAERVKQPAQAIDVDHISYKQALWIGLWQVLSLWPGFSRSGSTIAGGMLSGVNRAASADFTFIMAIPIMFVATGYSLLKSYQDFTSDAINFFVVGFVVSFIVAWVAVATFIRFVQKVKLTYFAYYRFALAVAFAIYLWV
jgi:undecaprenyl-diphosphatase